MKKSNLHFIPDGYFYFAAVVLCILLIAAVSLFAESKTLNTESIVQLTDSLNSGKVIYFDFSRSELKLDAFEILDEFATELMKSPDIKIEITGYTDNIGSDELNYALSQKRADAVKSYLISKGCREEQITTIAKGKEDALNTNETEDQRALNRRVVFKIVMPVFKNQVAEEVVSNIITKTTREEINAEISARDTTGVPLTGLDEKDITASLKWKGDSTDGEVRFLPIDDKKKIAYTLVLDYSPSMFNSDRGGKSVPKSDKILQMEKAVKGFVDMMPANAFLKIIKFGAAIDVVLKYTKSKELMYKGIEEGSYSRSSTALFKAIYTGLKDTTYSSNPTVMRTVIAFTDGMDNSSISGSKDSIFRYCDANGVRVFTIGLLSVNDLKISPEERVTGKADLREIASRTGGFFYNADEAAELGAIYKNIYNQIANSYRVSIKWNSDKLPPKGTEVTACIKVNIKGNVKIFYKSYIME